MRRFAILIACGVVLLADTGFSIDTKPETPSGKTAASPANATPSENAAVDDRKREPFKITREFEARMEEVEPPEIEVTGIFRAKGKTVAMAKLQLDKVEGRVVLRPGMRVSIPKPDRENSESEHWMTYFTVREISSTGMVIVLENGETVWYPVMGELD